MYHITFANLSIQTDGVEYAFIDIWCDTIEYFDSKGNTIWSPKRKVTFLNNIINDNLLWNHQFSSYKYYHFNKSRTYKTCYVDISTAIRYNNPRF